MLLGLVTVALLTPPPFSVCGYNYSFFPLFLNYNILLISTEIFTSQTVTKDTKFPLNYLYCYTSYKITMMP